MKPSKVKISSGLLDVCLLLYGPNHWIEYTDFNFSDDPLVNWQEFQKYFTMMDDSAFITLETKLANKHLS